MKLHLAAPAVVLVAVSGAALFGQQPIGQQPTFRAGVDLVQIDAVVVDDAGNPVTGLTANDFELRERNRPQVIATFSSVDIPLVQPLFDPEAAEEDVVANTAEGRLYLIAFDNIAPTMALRTRHFVRRFIETQMGANDAAALAYLGKGAANTQDFTSNKRLLLAQLDKFSGAFPGEAAAFNGAASQGLMQTFRDITEFLTTIRDRRKAMLLITGGSISAYDILDYRGGVSSIAGENAREAMIAATRANVVIYPIDPAGLTVGGGTGENEFAPTVEAARDARVLGHEAAHDMRALAEMTGGFAFVSQNTYEDAFARIVRENSSYYMLGYYSDNQTRDGRFRSVEVRVKRPGLAVKARTGYVAPTKYSKPLPAPTSVLTTAVSEALSSPIARTGVGMKLFAAPSKGAGPDASVRVVAQVDASSLGLVERDGVFTGELEVAVTATRDGKQYPGVYHIATLSLTPDTFAAARREGMRIVSDIALPPGTYQVRVAAGKRFNQAGSVIADVEVPDFTKKPLVLGGVSLGSTRLPGALTVYAGRALAPVPSLAATTSREFDADDTLAVFAEVYDNLKTSSPHEVQISAALIASDGRAIRTTSDTRSSSELQGSTGGSSFRAELPLAGISPGWYVVRLKADASTRDRPTAARDIPIRVR